MPALWNFQKADFNEPYLVGQKYTTFFLSDMRRGARFKYLPERYPYTLVYSALHIMQWFSHFFDVFTLKIKRKFLDFNILMNPNKCPLHKTWSDRQNVVHHKYSLSPSSNWCTNKLLPPVSSSSKHGCQRSTFLLYSISMVWREYTLKGLSVVALVRKLFKTLQK